jgi:ribosomal protein S18 acetylase RimI-like enzyme/SAM-dependent methyltransferase
MKINDIDDNTVLFSGKAESYAKARPSYPKEAVDYVCSLTKHNAVFADIGAGTGKWTELIAARGYKIFAVEPNDDMRKELENTLVSFRNVHIINGTDADTKIPVGSIDIITVAQALHWFDLENFRKECERILKPGGKVITVYNINPEGSSPKLSKLYTDEFYKNPTNKEFDNPIYYDRDDWINHRLSHSHDPKPGDENYESHIENVKRQFEERALDGRIKLDIKTRVYSEEAMRKFDHDDCSFVLASKENIPEIVSIYRSLVGTPGCTWDNEYPNRATANQDISRQELYLLKNGDSIVAVASVGDFGELADLPWKCKNPCELARIGVLQHLQNQGVGTKILRNVMEAAKAKGFDGVCMLVAKKNFAALSLYKKNGFKRCGEIHRFDHDFYCYEIKFN